MASFFLRRSKLKGFSSLLSILRKINYSGGAVVTAVAIAFHRVVIIKEAFMHCLSAISRDYILFLAGDARQDLKDTNSFFGESKLIVENNAILYLSSNF